MATLTSTKIKNTYDALLKASDNDAIGSSAKQITDGLGNGTPLYISTTQIGIGVTPEATYDLHVYSNAKVGGNLTVTGDLTVEGTTTTIDTQTLTVEDPLIEVASNNTSTDAVDIGWYGKYAPSGTVLYAGLFRDTGDSKFKLFRNLEEQPTTTVNTSGTGYTKATLVIGGLEATQVDLGDNEKIRLGASQDLEILHNSTIGRGEITNSTGSLEVTTTGNLILQDASSNKWMMTNQSGNVLLYNAGSVKFNTTSTGVAVTGDLTVDTDTLFVDSTNNRVGILTTNPSDALNVDDDVSGSVRITIDNANAAGFSTLRFEENDTERAALYYSNAADTFNLQNNTNSGNLRLQTTNSTGTTTSGIIINGSSEAVELYYAGTKKFETTSTGVQVTGDISIPVSNKLLFGGGSHTYISEDIDDRLRFFVGGAEFMRFTEGVSDTINFYQDVTFSGDLIVPEYIKHEGDADTSIRFTTNTIRFYTANNEVLELESDGQVNVISSGTATNPCITIGDDVNTGIWRPALDTFAVSTAGSERLRIDSSGRVGIGASPSYPLHLTGSGDTVAAVTAGASSIAALNLGNDTNKADGGIRYDNSADALIFRAANAEKMRIDSSGNVGIGGSPPSDNKLQIHNADAAYARFALTNSASGSASGDGLKFQFENLNGIIKNQENGYLTFGTNGRETDLRIDSSGNVGIGAQSVQRPLHIESTQPVIRLSDSNSTSTTDVSGWIEWYDRNNTARTGYLGFTSTGDSHFGIVNQIAGDVFVRTNNTEKMRITSGGDLQLKGQANPTITFITNSTTTTTMFSIISASYVGTAPYNANRLIASNSSHIAFETGGSERMRITSGGDVLIDKQTTGISVDGIEFNPNGQSVFTCTGGELINLNRRGSDGNVMRIYNDATLVGTIAVSGSTTSYNTTGSDERLKKNITNWDENILDKFKDIQPKEFHFNQQEDTEEKQKGYIAQNEVDKFPEAYPLIYNEEAKEDRHLFNPSGMTVYLMKAIQELKADNDSLRARIEALEN